MNKKILDLLIWAFLSLLIIFGGIVAVITKEITFLHTNKITRGEGAVYFGIFQTLLGVCFLLATYRKLKTIKPKA